MKTAIVNRIILIGMVSLGLAVQTSAAQQKSKEYDLTGVVKSIEKTYNNGKKEQRFYILTEKKSKIGLPASKVASYTDFLEKEVSIKARGFVQTSKSTGKKRLKLTKLVNISLKEDSVPAKKAETAEKPPAEPAED